jgi:hypothetical protein
MDSEEKYLVKFPNEEIRYQVAKVKSYEFETANVKAKVTPTDMAVDAEESWKQSGLRPTNSHLLQEKKTL